MTTSVLVLGAGMVGVCTALQLQRRGHSVCLVDRREPGEETSYGNAGIVQCEAMEPYPFPRDVGTLLQAALGRSVAINYHWTALPGLALPLAGYWRASAPARYEKAIQAYSALIRHALPAHEELMAACGAEPLVRRSGYHWAYHTAKALDEGMAAAKRLAQGFGVRHAVLDGQGLARAEPGLSSKLVGAIHWPEPSPVSSPGDLVKAYAKQFQQLGGQVLRADATRLQADGTGWQVDAPDGHASAEHAVIALGPWSDALIRPLGYRLPLFVKRGYHRHFAGGAPLRAPLLDVERGFVLAPMAQGTRLTTGAEFARLGSPATPVQVARATQAARELLPLGQPVEPEPWLGNRPCTADMLPVIGPAPRHPGLWFNFGHAHQGFTLGPACGQLMADLIEGRPPLVDPAPYRATRF